MPTPQPGGDKRISPTSAPASSYAICTTPRSGSWLLCEGLAATRSIGNPREWFNVAEEKKRTELWHIRFPDRIGFKDYLDRVLRLGAHPSGIFGVKLHSYQFAELQKRIRAAGMFPQLDRHARMTAIFPGLKYIWLTRRSKERQAISFFRALATGEWWSIGGTGPRRPGIRPLIFDPGAILELERILQREDATWRRYFTAGRIEPLHIVYEDMDENFAATVRDTLAWVGVPDPAAVTVSPPRLQRQADGWTEDWLGRYLEFKKSLTRSHSDESETTHPCPLAERARNIRESLCRALTGQSGNVVKPAFAVRHAGMATDSAKFS